jgi:hypothetical protein
MRSSSKKGSSSPSGGCSSKNAAFPPAFNRLSAGSIIIGGPEPPGCGPPADCGPPDCESPSWGSIPRSYVESVNCMDRWQFHSLQSLEGVVSAIRECAEAVDKVRQVFEEVSRENATAALAQARQLDSFSETLSNWCWSRDSSKRSNSRQGWRNGGAQTSRLLG